ncbi:RHS repeat domain-containing protein [Caulobacter mirabilis]|uniref:Transglutaminase-like domain-containing protein n=1 Tax=Caulobacter mirabilis TaxID=69666 RepID=A0A2D2AZI0_9CAUL|nr:RHS repeat domain-containing protein [Caulobacter mirabilis]ATQ43418.1 hypothetical protein CSW64_13850 [Caulobacter mirabilis]
MALPLAPSHHRPPVSDSAFAQAFGAVAATFLATLIPGAAAAQEALPPVASVKILKGSQVSLAQAAGYYGSATTATNGLCRDFPTNAKACTGAAPPAEIKALARALTRADLNAPNGRVADIDLIYEYVRNAVDTEFQFGLQKGAVGAIIDKTGTAFDQAQLMVKLAREAGYAARYKYGVVTLTGAQFANLTGVSKARAACDFMAAGGFPADVSTCADTETFQISFNHVWVEVTVDGANYFFDPALKQYEARPGVDVRALTGVTAGATATTARSGADQGVDGGVPYGRQFNGQGVNGLLNQYAANLLTQLKAPAMQGKGLDDIIGGQVMVAAARPAGGWRQATPGHYALTATWNEVPDQFRTRLDVFADNLPLLNGPRQTLFNTRFFADEIYGRKLQVYARAEWQQRPPAGQPYDPYFYYPELKLDDYVLASGPAHRDPGNLWMKVRLTADHPFAGAGGTFADATVLKNADFIQPFSIVHGWGQTSPNLTGKWDREKGYDELSVATKSTIAPTADTSTAPAPSPSGDMLRARVGATWLAQFSKAADIQARLSNSQFTHYHSLGVISVDATKTGFTVMDSEGYGDFGFSLVDEVSIVDVETAFALTHNASDAVTRRAVIHAVASTAAALEGSVVEQLTDTPDAPSTARRLAWGNAPECPAPGRCESPDLTSRRVYGFTTTDAAAIEGKLVFENLASGVHGSFQGQEPINGGWIGYFKQPLARKIAEYTTLGFDVTASAEAGLGPGYRHGTEVVDGVVGGGMITVYRRMPSLQIGGAFVANKYGASVDDPIEIANILTRYSGSSKGGGGSTLNTLDPSKAGDLLKDRFVDRSGALGVNLSNGSVGYTSPVLASVGSGEAPYKLERRVEMVGDGRGSASSSVPAITGGIGFVSNWNGALQFSNSGNETMGASRIEAASPTIAAFLAMQDVYRAAPSVDREVIGALVSDWWTRQFLANVATVAQGNASKQFVKLADGEFVPSAGGADRLIVTGQRRPVRGQYYPAYILGGMNQKELTTRSWNLDGLSFTLKGAAGDERQFELWKVPMEPQQTPESWAATGFRLKEWRYPRGVTVTLDYRTPQLHDSLAPTKVRNSLGLELAIPALQIELGGANGAGVLNLPDAAGGNTRLEFLRPIDSPAAFRPFGSWPLWKVFSPNSATRPSLEYAYDETWSVSEARDGNALEAAPQYGPHRFFIAGGYRGERMDPTGATYAVETPPVGGVSIAGATVAAQSRHIDGLGRVTTSLLDARSRVLQRTYPEGDRDQFKYDLRDNVIELRKIAKPTQPAADIVVTAGWETTWNKLAWIKDARGYQTDLSYVPSGLGAGEVQQVLQPEVVGGRPSWTFEYSVYGLLSRTIDPLGLETTFSYDARGNLLQSVADPAGLSIRTCMAYDALGNVVSQTDPRAASCP